MIGGLGDLGGWFKKLISSTDRIQADTSGMRESLERMEEDTRTMRNEMTRMAELLERQVAVAEAGSPPARARAKKRAA